MQLYAFSKLALRRNKTPQVKPATLLALLTLAFVPTQIAGAETILVHSFAPEISDQDATLQSLHDGHRAEIRFELRAYQTVSGIKRLFGDRLIANSVVLYEARWNELSNLYVVQIEGSTQGESFFPEDGQFIDFFFTFPATIIEIPPVDVSTVYVLCRVRLEPIKLVPPMTLLPLMIPGFRITSPWVKLQFDRI